MTTAVPGNRTWGDNARCDHCCNGDRCDDPTHYPRNRCPHCLSTGYALWTEEGRAEHATYEGRRAAMKGTPA